MCKNENGLNSIDEANSAAEYSSYGRVVTSATLSAEGRTALKGMMSAIFVKTKLDLGIFF